MLRVINFVSILVTAISLHAQVSVDTSSLHGVWTVRQYEVVLTKTLTRKLEKHFLVHRERIDSLNTLLDNGDLDIRVELKTDGTYSYKQTAQQRVEYYERGTWKIRDSSIIAHSSTHNERSALDGAKIIKRTADAFIVLFSIKRVNDGLFEKIYYQRKRSK